LCAAGLLFFCYILLSRPAVRTLTTHHVSKALKNVRKGVRMYVIIDFFLFSFLYILYTFNVTCQKLRPVEMRTIRPSSPFELPSAPRHGIYWRSKKKWKWKSKRRWREVNKVDANGRDSIFWSKRRGSGVRETKFLI